MNEQPTVVDLTPAGCTTPEGCARVNRAKDALDVANANCVAALDELLRDPSDKGSIADARTVLDVQKRAQDEFLRALCGR